LTGADSSNAIGDGLDHADDFIFRHRPGASLGLHDFKGALNILVHNVLTVDCFSLENDLLPKYGVNSFAVKR